MALDYCLLSEARRHLRHRSSRQAVQMKDTMQDDGSIRVLVAYLLLLMFCQPLKMLIVATEDTDFSD